MSPEVGEALAARRGELEEALPAGAGRREQRALAERLACRKDQLAVEHDGRLLRA